MNPICRPKLLPMLIASLLALPALALAQDSGESSESEQPLKVVVQPSADDPSLGVTINVEGEDTKGWFSRATESLFVFFEELEILNVEKEIDRYVGDPWTLHESTAYKISLLPFHLRYPLYRFMAQGVNNLDGPIKRIQDTALMGGGISQAVTFDAGASAEMASDVLEVLKGYFSDREILDLGVFVLSRFSFFPDNEADWNRLKHQIADFDVLLGLAVAIAGAASDSVSFSHSGVIFNTEKDGFRLGWYGSVRSLGVHLHPRLRAGLTGKVGSLELSAGGAAKVNGSETDEKFALEFALKQGLIDRFTRPGGGWELYLQAASRHVLAKGDAFQGDAHAGTVGLYGKRSEAFGTPWLNLNASAVLNTDFRDTVGYSFNLALENENWSMQALLQFAAVHDLSTGTVSYQGGGYVGGSFGSSASMYRTAMNSAGRVVEDTLAGIGKERREIAEAEKALRKFGTGARSVREERKLLDRIRVCTGWIEKYRLRVAARLADYYENRKKYHRAEKARGPLTDHFGHLDWDQVDEARAAAFGGLRDYASLVRSRLHEIRVIRQAQIELQRDARTSPAGTLAGGSYDLQFARLNGRLMDARAALSRAYETYRAYRTHARVIAKLDVGKKPLNAEVLDPSEDSAARGLLLPL